MTATIPTSSPGDGNVPSGQRHPRLTMHGPCVGRVAGVPLTEPIGELPYARAGRRPPRALVGVAILLAISVGVISIVVARGDSGTAHPTSSAVRHAIGSTVPSSAPHATSTTASPPTTAGRVTRPKTSTAALPPHLAVYRGGKLYLQGALPTRKVADAFVKKAAAVIGAANVVDRYVIDRRAPTPTDGRVRVDEPFLFPTGSAAIDPAYASLLNLGVTVMRQNPQVTMQVVGYTDGTGSLVANFELSRARAQAVADWIIAHGIDARRFIVLAKGPAEPVASNLTPEGRTRNRRIEVGLLGLLKG